jgi:hypothetical protein
MSWPGRPDALNSILASLQVRVLTEVNAFRPAEPQGSYRWQLEQLPQFNLRREEGRVFAEINHDAEWASYSLEFENAKGRGYCGNAFLRPASHCLLAVSSVDTS